MANSREINENKVKKIIKFFFSLFGYKITRIDNFNDRYNDFISECTSSEKEDLDIALKLALSSKANLWSIIQSLKYISCNNIKGDIIECGVYNGGSLALILKYIKKLSIETQVLGFDTFEFGFSRSTITDNDVTIKGEKLNVTNDSNTNNFYPTVEKVKKNIENFSQNKKTKLTLVKGDVLDTLKLKENIPDSISFLRLDTDLYETTKFQLEILYPKLTVGGILHIDDYGFFPGVRKAVDDYFKGQDIWLHRVDLTCRLLIKS